MMSSTRERDLQESVRGLPALDAHTHLVGGRLGARGLHDILLYHMAVSDLYAAGCPSGARLTQYPGWPTVEEAHHRIEEALPYLPAVRNTSTSWGVRIILRDLYGWDEAITPENWRGLDARIRERADDRAWQREIIARAGIKRICTEFARRENGQDDDILDYSLEWAFFTRCQFGEFDTALYELERCWGKAPESPTPIGAGKRPVTERTILSLSDVHEAVAWYVAQFPERILSHATHLSTDIDYRLIGDREMAQALSRRDTAGPAERDIYGAYINEAFLDEIERKHGKGFVFQFSFGAEPLPFETASRISQKTIAQLAEIIARHPGLEFHCHVSSAHANQSLCTLARELPNLTLVGCWWHNFFPSIITRVIEERLDMLPLNKQIGFFSDAYCIEWSYAKSVIIRQLLAEVLAKKVERGQYNMDEAVDIARALLYDTAKTSMGMHAS